MNNDPNPTRPTNIRSQLAPGWSGVNIGLMVLLFIVAWPLGLLMIAYILLGRSLGIDLSQPQTFSVAFERITRAVNAGIAEFNRVTPEQTENTQTPPAPPADDQPENNTTH